MAPHSSSLAWTIPWTEKPGGLQSMGSRRVGHDWATSLSLSCIGEGNGNPLQCSCLENPRDGRAWWAAVCGVAQSQGRLKRLSSSSKHSWQQDSKFKHFHPPEMNSLLPAFYIPSSYALIPQMKVSATSVLRRERLAFLKAKCLHIHICVYVRVLRQMT